MEAAVNMHQLRYLNEVVRCGLNISDAASSLYTSQPGISRQIKLLEEELGVDVFLRNGKRIVAITEPGKAVLEIARRILCETENLKRVGQDFSARDSGSLTVATTHTQARYALPPVVRDFAQRFPDVQLALHQGSPTQIAEQVLNGEVDIGIATESLALYDELVTLPCYEWHHCVIVPDGHPLLLETWLTLEKLAQYPIITYDFAFTGRNKINQAFSQAGITLKTALTAIDADVIKTYVELGMGVGIVAQMAFVPDRDRGLCMMDAGHLFQPSTTRIAIRRNQYLRSFAYQFIELLAPHLTHEIVSKALHPDPEGDA